MTADQEQLKYEHRDRVVDACALAIRHAALLLSPEMQAFADEIILKDNPQKIGQRKREAHGVDLRLIYALERLSRLRRTEAWVSQRHYLDLLTACWCGVAEEMDRQRFREGKREGEGDALRVAEQAYQQTVVKPLIEASFRTMWDEQDKLKKSAKNFGLTTVSQ
jgi:hypothetical protein